MRGSQNFRALRSLAEEVWRRRRNRGFFAGFLDVRTSSGRRIGSNFLKIKENLGSNLLGPPRD
jgi:hypothetical protein